MTRNEGLVLFQRNDQTSDPSKAEFEHGENVSRGWLGGGSRSRFTENKLVLSRFTGNKLHEKKPFLTQSYVTCDI